MKTDFNFISALTWSNWDFPFITFYGNSGGYFNVLLSGEPEGNGTQYIIWDGWHVATRHMGRVTYNPKAENLPKGFKSACKDIL